MWHKSCQRVSVKWTVKACIQAGGESKMAKEENRSENLEISDVEEELWVYHDVHTAISMIRAIVGQ